MKPYTVTIDIDQPRDRVIELFDEPENLLHWQNGLQSFEHLSGEPGQPGAKSKLVYDDGKRRVELIETIIRRDLPDEFAGSYEWPGGRNTMVNRFVELSPNKTRLEATCDFEATSLVMKAMAWVMSGTAKKHTQKFLDNFKAFAETGASVKAQN